MKRFNHGWAALVCASLASVTLISGCASDSAAGQNTAGGSANSNFPAQTNLPKPALFLNSFGSRPTTASAKVNGNTTTVFPVSGPVNVPTVSSNYASFIDGPTGSLITGGLIPQTRTDGGALNISGVISVGLVGGTATRGTLVSSAISPDGLFHYALSSAVRDNVFENVTAVNPETATVNALLPWAANLTGVAPANTSVTFVNNVTTPIFGRSITGINELEISRVDSAVPSLGAPPFALSRKGLGVATSFSVNKVAVHPSGSYLYILADNEGVGPVNTPAIVGGVEDTIPPAAQNDTLTFTPGSNNFTISNGTSIVNLIPVATASGQRVTSRGFVMIYDIDRNTGEPIDASLRRIFLPAGCAHPRDLAFGPNGTDLYISCYEVANDPATRVANASAVLHYRLSNTGDIAAAPTSRVDLPRGAFGLAFGQGFKRLYVSCQLSDAVFTGGVAGVANTGIPTGGTGSVRAVSVDPNNGTIALLPGAVSGGLAFPSRIGAHPTFDRLYVVEDGNLPTQFGQLTDPVTLGPVFVANSAITALQADSTTGALSFINRQLANLIGFSFYRDVKVDPSGQVLYAISGGSPLPAQAATTSNVSQAGGAVVHKIASTAGFTPIGGTSLLGASFSNSSPYVTTATLFVFPAAPLVTLP